jgi:sugar transferase (PEP-CTERM/EpsH1 system associated)
MAQFVPTDGNQIERTVMDFVDVDSDKWRQYAEEAHGPLSWIYRREHRALEYYERKIADLFEASVVVTEAEAELLRCVAPAAADRIHAVANGVDHVFFDPGIDFENPYRPSCQPIVFTGAMDYRANVDAVSWFASQVFPAVRRNQPRAEFWIVGSNPTASVQRLSDSEGVYVTGRVPDIRPYLSHACAAVAPLRVARGVQNKVIEAMAMDKPVICTPEAAEGLVRGAPLRVTPDPGEMSQMISDVLQTVDAGLSSDDSGRSFVRHHYEWSINLSRMTALVKAARLAVSDGVTKRTGRAA